ncbi:MAG: ThiF family adenylyltransferase [Candidatus Colwellbacteria bacterium]|nr:ThiF family adenylyltransferase [Candidatus Colwellbacteria bacterium]
MTEPVILMEGRYTHEDLLSLKNKVGCRVVDILEAQLAELYEIQNPSVLYSPTPDPGLTEFISKKLIGDRELFGDWIFFPCTSVLLHTVSKSENYTLRTSRNKNIITEEEQEKLRDFTISIAGLSVGGNIATTLAYNGFPGNLKLADFDLLETTNLNRIRGKLADVGRPKLDIISQQLYELDPYINITSFSSGIDGSNLQDFLGGESTTKLVFEIIDDLRIKILLRLEAKRLKIPLIMLTSIGDSVLIDVERYDTDTSTTPFNGLVEEKEIQDILSGKASKSEENKYVIKIVGMENIPQKVLDSVKGIGVSLIGRPQVMSTITVEAGIAVYLARMIALGLPVPSGRSRVKFEDFIKN